MYKMVVTSIWGHEVTRSNFLPRDTYKEAVVAALKKLRYDMGSEGVSLSWLNKGTYRIKMHGNFIGRLKLIKLVKR